MGGANNGAGGGAQGGSATTGGSPGADDGGPSGEPGSGGTPPASDSGSVGSGNAAGRAGGSSVSDGSVFDPSLEGFGALTPGGSAGRVVHVTENTDAAVRAAFVEAQDGNVSVVFDVSGPIEITSPLPQLTGAFVTIEGNCATLIGTGIGATQAMVDVRGHDVIVQDLRLRNAGDNLRAQGADAYNVVFNHISSTGAADDGISIGYGAHDVTLQYSFLAGNTRSIFIKYNGATNISVHHTWIMKQWIRGPLINGALVDLRNLIVEDWTEWGTRFEEGATGNAVSSLWILTPYAESLGGKPHATLYGYTPAPGPVWVEGNAYRERAQDVWTGTASGPFDTPPVTTQTVEEMEPIVRAEAGCMPRDAVDQAYIDLTSGWDVADGRPLHLP